MSLFLSHHSLFHYLSLHLSVCVSLSLSYSLCLSLSLSFFFSFFLSVYVSLRLQEWCYGPVRSLWRGRFEAYPGSIELQSIDEQVSDTTSLFMHCISSRSIPIYFALSQSCLVSFLLFSLSISLPLSFFFLFSFFLSFFLCLSFLLSLSLSRLTDNVASIPSSPVPKGLVDWSALTWPTNCLKEVARQENSTRPSLTCTRV